MNALWRICWNLEELAEGRRKEWFGRQLLQCGVIYASCGSMISSSKHRRFPYIRDYSCKRFEIAGRFGRMQLAFLSTNGNAWFLFLTEGAQRHKLSARVFTGSHKFRALFIYPMQITKVGAVGEF
jgi:hypothetical protein